MSAHRHQACLLWYQAMGVTDAVGVEQVNRLSLATTKKTEAVTPKSPSFFPSPSPTPLNAAPTFDTTSLNNINNLEELNHWLQTAPHNHSLAKTAQQAVLGIGAQKPKIIMLAEAPDRVADQSGQAWQTPELQWLKQAWTLAAPQMAADTYYMYLSPWRPPGQRPLTTDELSYCQTLLYKQLQWLNPDYIVGLGPLTARSLSKATIKNNSKQWFDENILPYSNKTRLALLPNAQNMLMSHMSKKASWQQLLSLAHQL